MTNPFEYVRKCFEMVHRVLTEETPNYRENESYKRKKVWADEFVTKQSSIDDVKEYADAKYSMVVSNFENLDRKGVTLFTIASSLQTLVFVGVTADRIKFNVFLPAELLLAFAMYAALRVFHVVNKATPFTIRQCLEKAGEGFKVKLVLSIYIASEAVRIQNDWKAYCVKASQRFIALAMFALFVGVVATELL